MKKVKTFTLEELTDKYVGKKGTRTRERFESDLKKDISDFQKSSKLHNP